MQPGMHDEKDVQSPHNAAIQFTRAEQPPKQEQVERHMRPREDDIAQLVIVDPVEQGKDAPLATANGVHLVDQNEGQPKEEEKVGHGLYRSLFSRWLRLVRHCVDGGIPENMSFSPLKLKSVSQGMNFSVSDNRRMSPRPLGTENTQARNSGSAPLNSPFVR